MLLMGQGTFPEKGGSGSIRKLLGPHVQNGKMNINYFLDRNMTLGSFIVGILKG